jgi:hypothetical protein
MSFNGNGVFLINTPGQPVVSGTTITSTAFNALTTDLASGLTNTITKDGQTNITANIPMSNFKITGLGAGTNPNDAVRLAQIQDGIINARFVNIEYSGILTGGTANNFLYSGTFTGGTGVVNLGSGQFYKDASGNVGIGTASPPQLLAVGNSTDQFGAGVSGAVTTAYFGSPSNASGGIKRLAYDRASGKLSVIGGSVASPATQMTVDDVGNVGIGTITTTYRTNIVYTNSSGGIAETGLYLKNTNTGNSTQMLFDGYRSWSLLVNGSFGVPSGGFTIQDNTAGVDRLNINSVGDVGIGTTSPAYRLDVQAPTGSISVTSTTGTNFSKFQVNNTGGSFQLAIDNSTGSNYGSTAAYARCVWNDSTTAPTLFYTNFAERMRIDASGNVSLNVTSAIGKFNVQSNNSDTAIAAGNASGTAAYNGALFYNNGFTSLVGQISISGSTASYLSVSDYRLKESVAPMTGALATVAQLKPVTYKWKADGSDGQGFIAHELQAVVPDCVTGDKDAVDDEGKPKYQGVDTSFLVATLTAAIQEQQAIISAMETRLAALEA